MLIAPFLCRYDESLEKLTEQFTAHKGSGGAAETSILPSFDDIEFGRRIAVERDLEKSGQLHYCNAVFDETGSFILYGSMFGIKVVNVVSNKLVAILGRNESAQRYLNIALYQGDGSEGRTLTLEEAASENPVFRDAKPRGDPLCLATAYKKSRFYVFSQREPDSSLEDIGERDVLNEKPNRDEALLSSGGAGLGAGGRSGSLPRCAVLHTNLGDITLKLFPDQAPKAVENFVTHAQNGYYDRVIFHRVIKGFMIQTGDPEGLGTGGESIWGVDFADEFHPTLKHDLPYTFSMANAGPNTNGSQFFITVSKCPWLDNKHTIFGRAIRGFEVVHAIEAVKTEKETDKPLEDVYIVNIDLKDE